MPKNKKSSAEQKNFAAAEIQNQPITEAVEKNFMPYAMSVIVSRAIPEIDGFKPAHRKLLYTMYKMGLLTGQRTKSANIVGQTMRLNPHGDSAIYETLVRLLENIILQKWYMRPHVIQNASLIHSALKYSEESTEMRSICAKIMTALC